MLASALATSPPWSRMADRLRIVVRTTPAPLLGVLGRAQEDDRPLLEALAWQIPDSLHRLLPIDHARTEAACGRLASRLHERVGAEHLRAARFVGLPRGGLFVLGLLSYTLELQPWQLMPDTGQLDDDTPVVIVDDCMLSGTQLRRWLQRHPFGPPIVAAHLHSHPDLRRAVERREARVAACVAGADLWDHAPDDRGSDYDDWRDRWSVRTPESYWIGNPDHVTYPWNEPDVLVWNERRAQVEPGWHVVPPRWCLKNRAAGGDAPAAVQTCSAADGALRPAADVVWAAIDDAVTIASADREVAVRLDGVAGQMWTSVARFGDHGRTVAALTQRYDADRATIDADLTRFVAQLAERGLLQTSNAVGSRTTAPVERGPRGAYPRGEVG